LLHIYSDYKFTRLTTTTEGQICIRYQWTQACHIIIHSVTSSYTVSHHHTSCHIIIHRVTSSYIVSHHQWAQAYRQFNDIHNAYEMHMVVFESIGESGFGKEGGFGCVLQSRSHSHTKHTNASARAHQRTRLHTHGTSAPGESAWKEHWSDLRPELANDSHRGADRATTLVFEYSWRSLSRTRTRYKYTEQRRYKYTV
jgi:hypothetical protein